jgi:Na+-driven multidrug efflux pump
MFPLGIQEATCCLVGFAIGANSVDLARRILEVTSFVSYIIFAAVSLILFLERG